jgi:hypothetical protein
MMPARPGVCISCGRWFDYRTKDKCRRCYRTAWQREKRQRENAARPPRPPKPPKPVREKRAVKPKPPKPVREKRAVKPKPEPNPIPALPRGWFAGTTPESRSAWAARFTPATTRREEAA